MDPRTNGRATSQQNADDPLHSTTAQLRDASAEQVIGANGNSVAASLRSSPPPRSLRDPLRRDVPTDTQRMQPQLLTSSERRNPGPDSNPSSRSSVYASDRDRPPPLPYDYDRDSNRVHETNEQDRERMRERRWSTDRRRFDYDRRPYDNDRRFPPDGRRRSSYDRRPPYVGEDRRPPQNDDSRPPHFEDKHPSSFVDRRMLDDRRIPDYERRPLSEEVYSGNAPSQDRPQEEYLGNERRVGPVQDMKTSVPMLSSVPPPNVAAVSMAPHPDPVAQGAVSGDHRSSVSSAVPMVLNNQVMTSSLAAPLDERSNQVSSLHEHISGTYSHLGSRAEPTRPFFEERPTQPPDNPGATPASLPALNQSVADMLHTRVSEPSHATNLRPDLNDDQERYSIPTADSQSRSVSAAYTHALSVGRDESRSQPPPSQLPQPRASTPSTFSSTQPSPSLRAREPSRERPPNARPYFRSEFSRPVEDTRRPDAHSSQPGENLRRYDERGRWSPQPGDRRGYRDYYDRDRPYWDNKDRARVLPTPPEAGPPPYWDRERTRYPPEASYSAGGIDRRFEDRNNQGNRDRWYQQPSYDNASRRPFYRLPQRGRPRSPGSPSREPTELRPPPPKRMRDEAYVEGHSATGDGYYSHPPHPQQQQPPPPPAFPMNKDPLPPRPPSVPVPVPIPISRPTPLLPPSSRYSRPPPFEPYGGPEGGYEYDGGRGPAGPGYQGHR